MIKAILFDLDGVVVDAVDWHFSALNQALSLIGYRIPRDTHDSIYNGLPTFIKLRKLSESGALPISLHPFINEMKQRYTLEILKKNCRPSKKVSSLLKSLSEQGFSLGLCSNSNRVTVDTVLDLMQIRNFFDVVLSANDIHTPKPSPEIYEQAMHLLELEPHECLILEDSSPGIESANASEAHVLPIQNPEKLTLDAIEKKVFEIDGLKRKSSSPLTLHPPIEIIIPMAGLGTRFSQVGYAEPKPLIPVLNKPMIQWVVENVRPKNFRSHFTFICNEEHLKKLAVEALLRRLEPTCTIIPVKETTAGAACTVLLAYNRLLSARPVLIANSDQWVDFEIDRFIQNAFQKESDGSILTFQANDKKWSYAKLDRQNQWVTEVAEKSAISPHATVGIYFFRQAYQLAQGLQSMVRKNLRTNGEFYLCPVYNELLADGKKIQIFEIPASSMHGLGTPEDLATFLEKNG